MKYENYVCHNAAEVAQATQSLDKAGLGPLKIEDNGVWKEVNNWKGLYNISKGEMCTAVVPYYNLVQHKEYFDSFAQAMDRLNLKYTMTITQQGNKAIADIDFENKNIKFDKLGEEFTTGIRLMNSYDKTYGIFIIPKFTRLACSNGMILTRSEKVASIKHTDSMVKEMAGLVESRLAAIIGKSTELQNWVSSSMKDSEEWLNCCRIIEKLFLQIKHRSEILKRLGISIIEVEDKKTKKKLVQYVWDDPKKKKNKFTRWEVYNAVTHYLTHGEQMTPHIQSLFHKQAERILIKPLSELPMAEATING